MATLGIDVAAFNTARQKVLGEAVCREALRATPPPSTRIALPLPEQLSPGRLREARQQGDFPADVLDGDARDAVVGLLSGALGNATLSIAGLVGMQLFGLAQRLGVMNHVHRSAGAISDASYPFAGDVLMYLARGDAIRDFIAARIEAVPGPVLLVAHSLGGIACVDLLARRICLRSSFW